MTRKDYQLIAQAIVRTKKEVTTDKEKEAIDRLADELACRFEGENPSFNRNKFLEAAEVP